MIGNNENSKHQKRVKTICNSVRAVEYKAVFNCDMLDIDKRSELERVARITKNNLTSGVNYLDGINVYTDGHFGVTKIEYILTEERLDNWYSVLRRALLHLEADFIVKCFHKQTLPEYVQNHLGLKNDVLPQPKFKSNTVETNCDNVSISPLW